jgi:hypothetical protein
MEYTGKVVGSNLRPTGAVSQLGRQAITPPGSQKTICSMQRRQHGRHFDLKRASQTQERRPQIKTTIALEVNGKEGDVVRVRVVSGRALLYDENQALPGPLTIKLHSLR